MSFIARRKDASGGGALLLSVGLAGVNPSLACMPGLEEQWQLAFGDEVIQGSPLSSRRSDCSAREAPMAELQAPRPGTRKHWVIDCGRPCYSGCLASASCASAVEMTNMPKGRNSELQLRELELRQDPPSSLVGHGRHRTGLIPVPMSPTASAIYELLDLTIILPRE